MSELFEPRKGNDTKTAPLARRHAELCQHVLKILIHDLIPNCPLFFEKASKSWDLLTRLLLGITDNLLWNDKQNYLADDLAEQLLNSLFFTFLHGGIYCDELWKKFAACFKLWCHRLKSVLVWGSVIVSLNSQIALTLNHSDDVELVEIKFGLHSIEYKAVSNIKFAYYSWTRLTNFLPKLATLSGEIFLRALQSIDKLVNTWHSSSSPMTPIDRNIPDANTILEIYGEYIFEAAAVEKVTHEKGRAIAISLICLILSKWQYRESISSSYISTACSCLEEALLSDPHASASVIHCIEPVLVSGHLGVLSLAVPTFTAIRRLLMFMKSPPQKSPLPNVHLEELRMSCYRLISLIYSYFSESSCPLDLSNLEPLTSLEHVHSKKLFQSYGKAIQTSAVISIKAHILDGLLGSLLTESHPENVRFLLNSTSAQLYSDYSDIPELLPLLVQIFEDFFVKPPVSWNSSVVDTQIVISRILEQWSRIGPLPQDHSSRLCLSLTSFSISLHAKSNLPLYFRLIISLYDSIFSWLSASNFQFACVSAFISVLVKFMKEPSSIQSKVSTRPNHTSPSLYGLKNRKSLSERVFTIELGNEDQRPESLSPTLLKGIDEIFLEYTDSILQRLIGLLVQEQINSNFPLKLDSYGTEFDFPQDVKYYAVSSSILIGFTEQFMFVRNATGKFIWSHDYRITEKSSECFFPSEPASIILDLEPVDTDSIVLFRTPLVVTHIDDHDPSDFILNDENWTKALNDNRSIASKISPVLSEVEDHLKLQIIPKLPQKLRLNRVHPQPPVSITAPEIISRLFLTHIGFLNSSTYTLVSPVDGNDNLICDLKRLDALPNRQVINIPVHFVANSSTVSRSFDHFVKQLGGFTATSPGPIFSDLSLEANFPIIRTDTDATSDIQETVSIIWSEDCEPIQQLPPSKSNLVYFVISPHLIDGQKGLFFRIRILLTRTLQAEYTSLQSLNNVN